VSESLYLICAYRVQKYVLKMKKPPCLKKGDKIAIISTARKITIKEIQSAIDLLTQWELEVVLGENLFQEDNQFSGTVTQRVADLQHALDNKEIKAIIFARGGYGTVQLIEHINFDVFKTEPKWLIGYSDVTVLHNHINQNFNIQTLHASMPINFTTNTVDSLNSIKQVLFGGIGGNLSIIYSLTGTSSQIDTQNKILFIEDLDEYLYHIDRMMFNLQRAGMLSNLAGLIVGGMSDMNDNTIPFGKTAKEIILEHTQLYNYPICFDFPAGHLRDNRSLIMGSNASLKIDKNKVIVNFD